MTSPLPSIDAHAHVFRYGSPLATDRRYAPDYDAPVELYLDELDRHGISHGVLVQPSFLGTDNSYLVESLRRADGRLRGVAVLGRDVTLDEMSTLDGAGVVGLRLNLVDRPLPDLRAAEWRSLLRMVRSLGWHVEVQRNASDLVGIASQLLEADVCVVLDHFGLPDPVAGAADPGFSDVLGLGRSRKVWVKISAPYRSGPDIERLARRLYAPLRAAFGPDRLMWGSDWPHTRYEATQTFGKNLSMLTALVGEADEREAILASPRSLYRF